MFCVCLVCHTCLRCVRCALGCALANCRLTAPEQRQGGGEGSDGGYGGSDGDLGDGNMNDGDGNVNNDDEGRKLTLIMTAAVARETQGRRSMTTGGARLLVYAGGERESLGAGGGMALVTGLAVGGSRGG